METTVQSQYLSAIKQYFDEHRGALVSKGVLEFEEETHSVPTEELWEAVLLLKSDVYLVLTIWGDARATFVVREHTKKRMHKLLLRVPDFPLLVSPAKIFNLFKNAASGLYLLSTPPGAESDRELLDDLRRKWLSLSSDELH